MDKAINRKKTGLGIFHEASPIDGRLTVSIGISALVPVDGMTVEHLMDEADNALYKAKRYGRNQFQFSE